MYSTKEITHIRTVLFICEHGSAKSVVAAAHFNRLSAMRGLDLSAISRGTDPDAAVHPVALAGLAADGLAPATNPILLSESDLSDAVQVVLFSELLTGDLMPSDAEVWTVSAVSEDYAQARNEIVSNIEQLLAEIA